MGYEPPVRRIFDDEHEQFRSAFRGFLAAEAAPHAEEWLEDGIISRGFWRRAAEQGFVGFTAPPKFGGLGVEDFRFNAVIDEEIVHSGVGTDAFMMTNDILGPYLWNLTTHRQKERWLPGVTDGSLVPAIAMTEPAAGSDLRSMRTRATPDGDGYRISGSKTFITSGIQADLVVVAAQVPTGSSRCIGLFVVENGMPGFTKGRKLDKLGRRAQDTAELFFEDVPLPAENVLGDVTDGFALLMRNLPQERLAMAVAAVANVEHVLDLTLDYVSERTAFGSPIGSFQANRFDIAQLVTEARACRTYVDDCIRRHTFGGLDAAEAAGVKFLATDLEWRTVDRCLQLHGGYGYMTEYEIATRWRDARVQRIYGGTNEIMREIVGRSLGL